MSKGKIPIKAAERISDQYDCPMIIIFAVEPGGERFTVTTYGKTKPLCRFAADLGNKIADAVLHGKIVPAQDEPVDIPNKPMIYESRMSNEEGK